jgi:hypothetical protein
MADDKDPRVDAYIDALPSWQQEICREVRNDGAIVPDPEGIITGGHENTTAHQVAVYEGEPINAPALKAMFEQIIANNRAGRWRKLKRDA